MEKQRYAQISSLAELRACRLEVDQEIDDSRQEILSQYTSLSKLFSLSGLSLFLAEHSSSLLSGLSSFISLVRAIFAIVKNQRTQ